MKDQSLYMQEKVYIKELIEDYGLPKVLETIAEIVREMEKK